MASFAWMLPMYRLSASSSPSLRSYSLTLALVSNAAARRTISLYFSSFDRLSFSITFFQLDTSFPN